MSQGHLPHSESIASNERAKSYSPGVAIKSEGEKKPSPKNGSLYATLSSSDSIPTLLHGLPAKFTQDNPRFNQTELGSRGSPYHESVNKLQPSSDQSNGGHKSVESSKKPVLLPETSSTGTGCINDHGLAEVPLTRLINSEHLRQSPVPYSSAPLSPYLSTRRDLQLCTTDHTADSHSPSDRLEAPPDDFPLSGSFIHSCADNARLNLPQVEDGLSSGSELDTPHVSRLGTSSSQNETRAVSYSPDSTRGLFLPSSRSTTHSQRITSMVNPCTADSLITPPLVNDIWGIVNDIKQSLTDNGKDFSETTENDQQLADLTLTENGPPVKTQSFLSAHPPMEGSSVQELTRIRDFTVHQSPSSTAQSSQHYTNGHQSRNQLNHSPKSNHRMPNTLLPCNSNDRESVQMHSALREAELKRLRPTLRELALKGEQSCDSKDSDSSPKQRPARQSCSSSGDGSVIAQQVDSSMVCSRIPRLSNATEPHPTEDYESDEDTDQLLNKQYQTEKSVYIPELKEEAQSKTPRESAVREDAPNELIDGILFVANYLGSTQLISERRSTRSSRMFQVQEAVNRIKAPDGENQPSSPVKFFVSTDRLIILNSNLQEIIIDHELRMISYIADVGNLFVLIAKRPDTTQPPNPDDSTATTDESTKVETEETLSLSNSHDSVDPQLNSTPLDEVLKRQTDQQSASKMICHVLESDEARVIAQSVGHAFQLAYLDFVRQQGVDDSNLLNGLNNDQVMRQQQIFCDELALFADKDRHKQVIIPKQRGEPLGIAVVASGWGSLLPTCVLANMRPTGPAARCGQLNIGNHIISVNAHSLVGLTLPLCQQIIKACRQQTSVQLVIIDSPPVVEVLIHRPSLRYQLGFSVQDGVICSLLRGGIAERGGIRVDHRIIEINGESVVAVPHERIVNMLATSVGDIHIRTISTSVFRLLTGQETPNYI